MEISTKVIKVFHFQMAIIEFVLLYGAETWTMTKILFKKQDITELFGPTTENGIRRIRKNMEIRNMYMDPDIIAVLKIKSISVTHPQKI